MKKLMLMIIITIAVMMTACREENLFLSHENEYESAKIVKHAISPEDARSIVEQFLKSEKNTRGGEERKIESVIPICIDREKGEIVDVSENATRGFVLPPLNPGIDTLLYATNFYNEGGYALVIADEYDLDPLIAVIDEGCVSLESMNDAAQLILKPNPPFPNYPLTGPGIFTDSRYPGEEFINPNTFKLYIPEQNDTLVGTIVPNSFKPETASSTEQELHTMVKDITIDVLCLSYALDRANNSNIPDIRLHPLQQSQDGFVIAPGAVGTIPQIQYVYSDWKTVSGKAPLLTNYVDWHQGAPFNNLYPAVRYFFGNDKRKASAGCFPLAIAKTFAYFKAPSSIGGKTMNWTLINNNLKTVAWDNAVANLLNEIRKGVNAWCFYEGTFAFPLNVKNFLKECGYSNVKIRNYDFDRIKEMLMSNKPVFIYGMPGVKVFASHAWNIDGYIIKERTITQQTYISGYWHDDKITTENKYMVHCDFGWGGSQNGYYVSKIFDTQDENRIPDGNNDPNDHKYYNRYLHTITYDH